MKKFAAILLILCIGASMILMIGCEKQQIEEEPEAMSAPADTAAVADSAMVEPMEGEETVEEPAE